VRDGRARRNAEEADGGEHLDDTNTLTAVDSKPLNLILSLLRRERV
jgi:hypothetical protein